MPSPRVTRRQENIRQEIKAAARRLMAERGTAGLSLRAIAREIDMLPSGLYHYYPNLDGLITDLITDNFNALADALESAQHSDAGRRSTEQLAAVLLAYRQWAIDHPVDFQLIYGNPIPGYAAPREVTLPPVVRGFAVILGLVEAMLRTGEISPAPPYTAIPPEAAEQIQSIIERDGYTVSPLALYLSVVAWGQLHGIIMLELFNHLQPVIGNVEGYYRAQVHNLLVTLGLRSL